MISMISLLGSVLVYLSIRTSLKDNAINLVFPSYHQGLGWRLTMPYTAGLCVFCVSLADPFFMKNSFAQERKETRGGPSFTWQCPSFNWNGPSLNWHGPSLIWRESCVGPYFKWHSPFLNWQGPYFNWHSPYFNWRGPSLIWHCLYLK